MNNSTIQRPGAAESTCARCGHAIPRGQLVCLCFSQHAEEEAQRLALIRFASGQAPLYLSATGHLGGRRGDNVLAFCRRLRIDTRGKHTDLVVNRDVERLLSPRCCRPCYEAAAAALEAPAARQGGAA